jgi:hypothetical protein
MASKIISKFWDVDHTKMAVVHVDTKTCCYFIEFFKDDKPVDTVHYPNKSLYFVEDAAENYTLGILNIDTTA